MERHTPSASRAARPLVLIADAHDDTRELYAAVFTSFGFETATLDDDADPFTRVSETRPDIIVTEVVFPRRDGWRLVEDLHHDPRTSDIPIVVVTSHAEPSVLARAKREGCAAVFIKPFLPERLALALRDVLYGPREVNPVTESVTNPAAAG